MDLFFTWLDDGLGWIFVVALLNICVMLVAVWRSHAAVKKADKAYFIAIGSRDRSITVHKEMSKVTGEVRRMTGEQNFVVGSDINQEEFDDVEEGNLDTTQKRVRKMSKKKKRRSKKN
jgi:hypothetical protein